jgi:hypothetical protein
MNIPQGTWTAQQLWLVDHAGNRLTLNATELEAMGFPTTFEQTGPGDSTPPQLHSFSFTPKEVSTSLGPQTIVFTAEFSDDLTGFAGAQFEFVSPTGVQRQSVFMTQPLPGVTPKTTYVGTLELPRYAEQGTWTLDRANWEDSVYNAEWNVQPEWFAERGIETTFYNGPTL